jgi:hypothetical protein
MQSFGVFVPRVALSPQRGTENFSPYDPGHAESMQAAKSSLILIPGHQN